MFATELEPADSELLAELLERHYDSTGSARALQLLLSAGAFAQHFRVVRPLGPQDATAQLDSAVAPLEARVAG
jgi:hypothetical protein